MAFPCSACTGSCPREGEDPVFGNSLSLWLPLEVCAGHLRSCHGSRQDREQELLDLPVPGIPSLTSGHPGIDPGIGGFRGDYKSVDFAVLGCLARAAPWE